MPGPFMVATPSARTLTQLSPTLQVLPMSGLALRSLSLLQALLLAQLVGYSNAAARSLRCGLAV